MNVLDLFSGIGGFSLGLERAGFNTLAFCEIDPYCQQVLRRHWPVVPIFPDVKQLKYNGKYLSYGKEPVKYFTNVPIDVICGGFPCQDISVAGPKKGLSGERSGLWKEYKRLIKEIGPRYAIIENVANLRSKGLARLIKDLWQIGYSCEWHIISARSIGAPHLRERIWIIAYPCSKGLEGQRITCRNEEKHTSINCTHDKINERKYCNITDSHNFRLWQAFASQKKASRWWAKASSCLNHWEETQSFICGVDDGLPRGLEQARKERIKALGNAVVPQIPEFIGREIMRYESNSTRN